MMIYVQLIKKRSWVALAITIIAFILSFRYEQGNPAKDLANAKLAVKQLEHSDASYLTFAYGSDLSLIFYLVTGVLLILTAFFVYKDIKGE